MVTSLSTWIAAASIVVTQGQLKHDFGVVKKAASFSYTIELHNTGSRNVTIKEYKSNCSGCSALRINREIVPPKQKATLTLRLDSGKKSGDFSKKVFVQAIDADTTSLLELEMAWHIPSIVECLPEAIDFGQKTYRTPYDTEIHLRADEAQNKLQVLQVSCSSPFVAIRPPQEIEQGKQYAISLSILPSAPLGEFITELTIKTNYPREPLIIVPIRGTILGPFKTDKGYINFGVVPVGRRVTKELGIAATLGMRERITSIDFDKHILDCSLVRDRRDRFSLKASFLPTVKAETIRTTVTLHTSCPVQPTISLPVLAIVRGG